MRYYDRDREAWFTDPRDEISLWYFQVLQDGTEYLCFQDEGVITRHYVPWLEQLGWVCR